MIVRNPELFFQELPLIAAKLMKEGVTKLDIQLGGNALAEIPAKLPGRVFAKCLEASQSDAQSRCGGNAIGNKPEPSDLN